jgi:hypothetical protein
LAESRSEHDGLHCCARHQKAIQEALSEAAPNGEGSAQNHQVREAHENKNGDNLCASVGLGDEYQRSEQAQEEARTEDEAPPFGADGGDQ